MIKTTIITSALLFAASVFAQNREDLDVFAMHTGNPTIPAYLADATIVYDKKTDMFYAYGTNDGNWFPNVYPPQMWYSKDCKSWINRRIDLPKQWTDENGTERIWAPSMIYYPPTKKYYLMYAIYGKEFVAMSDSPMGAWEDANAVAPGKMLHQGIDGQFFLDDDQTMYLVTDQNTFKIIKLQFDAQGKMYIDNTDARFTNTDTNAAVGKYAYKGVSLRSSFEGALIYKRNGLYYLMWSTDGSERYNVRYAVSEDITGPYREVNSSLSKAILQRDDSNRILGPGHHSMFDYKGRTFIAYHRQFFPFIDGKRQTCIDEVFFAPDGSILPITPTHKGVDVVAGAKRYKGKNLALGKPVKVSSARHYDPVPTGKRYRTPDIDFDFTGNYAVDDNYGTRWDPGVEAEQPWLVVDLESEHRIKEVETIFEFTNRTYKYKLEYLSSKDAQSLDAATVSSKWQLFADRSGEGAPQSPVKDKPAGSSSVKARFVRLTILSADIPERADPIEIKNSGNALSIFEIRVFGK